MRIDKKSTSGMSLPPGNRHHWDPAKAARVRLLRDAVMPLVVRSDDRGFDNIPQQDNFLAGPTHQSMLDAAAASRIPGNRPFGSMADVNQFKGLLGACLADLGAFPVDRYGEYEGDFPNPVGHAQEILNSGKSLLMYPEGRIFETGHVQPLKSGIGRIAVGSDVKYALPVAQHYSKDTKFHPGETAFGIAAAAGVTAAGVAAACAGGTPAAIAGFLTGIVPGALLGAGTAYLAHRGEAFAPVASAMAKGALAGAAATAVTTGLVGALAPGASGVVVGTTAGLTGLAGLGLTYHWTHRPVATTSIGQPIAVEPYRIRARASNDPNAAKHEANRLTADFHTALKNLKDEITGKTTPYKMDVEGRSWGQQADGRYVLLEQADKRNWTPVQPLVFEQNPLSRP